MNTTHLYESLVPRAELQQGPHLDPEYAEGGSLYSVSLPVCLSPSPSPSLSLVSVSSSWGQRAEQKKEQRGVTSATGTVDNDSASRMHLRAGRDLADWA